MILIEIAHPAGALDADDHSFLAEEIAQQFTGDDGLAGGHAPEETMNRARTVTHVGFHELSDWHTGDGPWHEHGAPPVWATATLPRSWQEEMATTAIAIIRRGVRRLDRIRGWSRTGGDLWINVVGIADGCLGLNGKPSTAEDLLDYLTEDYRAKQELGQVPEPPAGVLVDPVCGMYVKLGPKAITVEHDGTTVGFCAAGCRDRYLRDHPAAAR